VSGDVVADEYALDQTGSSSSAVAIHAPATNELAIRTNSTEAMRIDSDGNVGIGTTDPGYKLDVKEVTNGTYAAKISNAGGDSYGLLVKTSSGTTENYPILDLENTAGNVFRVQANGNVGIGTTSPSAPLEVASTTGGVIMPRMTTTQMNAISSPTDGEMIYNTTANKFYGRANGAWVALH
jgi:hypothetical protein